MKTILLIVVPILLIVAGGAYYFLGSTPSVSCAERTPVPRVVAFGDSLVEGYGATTDGGFVTLLSQGTGVPITNLGVRGDTTESALTRIASVVDATPDITLVLLGGNDALRKVRLATTEQNLATIIDTLQQNKSKVVLIGVIGGLPDPYSSMYKRLAKKYDVTYVPNVLSGILGHADLTSDSIHPNEAGYTRITDRLTPILEKECARL